VDLRVRIGVAAELHAYVWNRCAWPKPQEYSLVNLFQRLGHSAGVGLCSQYGGLDLHFFPNVT
jgi:hypothetical protein